MSGNLSELLAVSMERVVVASYLSGHLAEAAQALRRILRTQTALFGLV